MTFLAGAINYLDLAIFLVIFTGVCLGAARGITKTIKKSFIIVLLISLMLCSVIGGALESTSLGESLNATLTTKLTEVGGDILAQDLILINDTYYVIVNGQQIPLKEAIAALNNPTLNFVALFVPMFMQGASGISVIDKIVPQLSKMILIGSSFIVTMIVVKIIFILINMVVQKVFDKLTLLRWLDRLLGALYSGIKSVFFVLVALSVVSLVAGMDISGIEVLNQQIDTSVVGKWLIDNNVLSNIFASVFNKG